MYPQTNIVSFDAARRRAASQRSSTTSRDGHGSSRPSSDARYSAAGSASSQASRSANRDQYAVDGHSRGAGYDRAAAMGSRSGTRGGAYGGMRANEMGSAYGNARFDARAGVPRMGASSVSSRMGASWDSASSVSSRASSHMGAGRSSFASSRTGEAFERDTSDSGRETQRSRGLIGRLRESRRARTKERADRAYFQQYEKNKPSDASQSGPRAAVYKGEMGSSHKRSSRMQQDGGSARSFKGSAGMMASSKRSSRRAPLVVVGAFLLTIVFSSVMLYQPAQQFYTALREKDRLVAEYQAVVERNEAIDKQVKALQTDAGVEDMARMELGWAYADEHVVSVSGLDKKDESTTFRGNIVSEDIPFPDTWYSSMLDPLFGVQSAADALDGSAGE